MKSPFAAVVLAAAVASASAAACAQPAATAMSVLIKPSAMSETMGGGVEITTTVEGMDIAAGAPLFRLGAGAPGMPTPQPVEGMTISDDEGAAPLTKADDQGEYAWTASRRIHGRVVAHYRLPIDNARGSNPPVALHIDGDTFSAPGRMLLALPQVDGAARVAIRWDLTAMGPGAVGISSFGDGDVEAPAFPIARLAETAFGAGHFHRQPEGPSAGFSALWGGEPPFDPRELMRWTARLHSWMSGFFKDAQEPAYRVILRANPQNPGGGVAYFQAFVVGYGDGTTAEGLKSIFGHEMTHTWTAAGEDIGKWYNEGNAVYYQGLLPWRAGLITIDDYLANINRTASRYYTNPQNRTPEADVARQFWENTYVRVLPYDRGAMYFAVLDGKVRRASAGKRSIDDLIGVMVGLYRSGRPMTEQTWIDVLRGELGEDGVAVHRTMMAGGLMVPESGDFGPCFRRTTKLIRRFDPGFDILSMVGPEKILRGLKPGSEAARAGLRDGDRIVSAPLGDAVQADVERVIQAKVIRDGQTLTFTYLPRGEAVDAYQWERAPGASQSACR
jgi:hypothetical protein